jgi:outer membrane protein TolC
MLRLFVTSCVLFAAALPVSAQISFTTAIDLALRSNPKVLSAQADVDKERAQLAESRDAYIPTLIGASGLGYSYGFPLGQPTVFSLTSQSLLFNSSQRDFIRAARAGLEAANFALKDARQQVEEDTAVTYLSLDQAQKRKAAIAEEYAAATRLVSIVQARLDVGQDSTIELLRARRTSAQLHLLQIQADDDIDSYVDHLSRLTALPSANFEATTSGIPALASPEPSPTNLPDSPTILAAMANARAKQHQAFGDSRYLWRPQVAFFAQYSRFSDINNYTEFYPTFNNFNAVALGVQISFPMFDPVHQAKARQSLADASHAVQEATNVRNQVLESRLKLRHATSELAARAEVAAIDREIAQNQLDAVLIQLQAASSGTGAQLTPKDEQNARIQERQKYLDLLDADLQLRQAQINLLRQNGQLEDWLKSAAHSESQPQLTASPVNQ